MASIFGDDEDDVNIDVDNNSEAGSKRTVTSAGLNKDDKDSGSTDKKR